VFIGPRRNLWITMQQLSPVSTSFWQPPDIDGFIKRACLGVWSLSERERAVRLSIDEYSGNIVGETGARSTSGAIESRFAFGSK
jgi:hypothetical protein